MPTARIGLHATAPNGHSDRIRIHRGARLRHCRDSGCVRGVISRDGGTRHLVQGHVANDWAVTVNLRPVTLAEARRFVGEHHRHNLPPRGWLFGVGIEVYGELVGVAVAGRPVARALDDGLTVEITRACTLGHGNANSMLYGALRRAAKALGYRRVYTYTLAEESGCSLRAAGFVMDAELAARPTWDTPSRARDQTDLFGNERRPAGPKVRWKWEAIRG